MIKSPLLRARPISKDLHSAFIREHALNGHYLGSFSIDPERYNPTLDSERGAKNSGGFESLTPCADHGTLYAAFEKPL